jgi:competence ComEA-like helix-hairpin-helix protein
VASSGRLFPWLNRGDRLVLACVCALLIAVFGIHYALAAGLWGDSPKITSGAQLPSHQVDINTAEWWELQAVHGIGEARARDIVAHRQRHGPYETVGDLTKVSGIGAKTIERLRPHLTVSTGNSE